MPIQTNPNLQAIEQPTDVQLPSFERTTNQPPDYEAPGYQAISSIDIEEADILSNIQTVAENLMTGELPQDVIDEVVQTTSELGINRGVFGTAQEFTTARAFGLTSLDLMEAGLEVGLQVGEIQQDTNVAEAGINAEIAQANQDTALGYSQLQESIRQWEDTMLQQSIENTLDFAQLTLATAGVVSENQAIMNQHINDIIIGNSRYEIEGASDIAQSIADIFGVTDTAILNIMGIL